MTRSRTNGINPPSGGRQATRAIVSVGYEGRSVDEFVALLAEHEVDDLIDVRLTPISRKAGFSKTALSQALQAVGIAYHHEPDLGNPKSNRDPYRRGHASARRRYEARLTGKGAQAYATTMNRALEARVALLCFERDHAVCHRSSIVDFARREDPELEVLEL